MRIRQDEDRDEAKDELLEKAVQLVHARRSGGGGAGEGVATLLPVYYRHVALEDIETRSPTDIYGAAVSHYRLALERPQGTATVRVFTPTVDEHGWSADGHTVVEIVTDDMPFLVDSVTMSLSRAERALHLVIHPQLLVQRDVAGNLIHLLKGDAERYGDTEEPADVVRESWMHVEIDRETDREALARIEADLNSVLRDVRETVEDWHKMKAKAEDIIAQLADDPPPLDEEEVTETSELLTWLADDHFTFLGYREYSLLTLEGEDALRAVPGTGLGILRSDQDMSASFGKLPPKVREKAREKQLLIITKANSRATVHRPAYLDYVGVKLFDEHGEVVGERRFLGLFSSAAYTESVTRIPVLRR
jgi:glutamate dehydrogenase